MHATVHGAARIQSERTRATGADRRNRLKLTAAGAAQGVTLRRAGGNIARGALLPLLLLGPLVVVLDRLHAAGEVTVFVLAATALIPLS